MARSELYAEAYARLASGLGNLSTSATAASEREQTSQEKVKASADKSTLQQLVTYMNKLYDNYDPENPDNEGYIQKLSRTYDTAEFDNLEQATYQAMYDKMTELGVNDDVRKMWEDNYGESFRKNLNSAKGAAYTQNYASTTAQKWSTKIEEVATSNKPLSKKREELQSYWNETNLDNIVPYVKNMPTVEQAWRSMITTTATQGVDDYYATIRAEGVDSGDESSIAKYIIQGIKNQIPKGQELTASEEFALQQAVVKQIDAHETQLQKEASENYTKLTEELLKIPYTQGKSYGASDVMTGAVKYGAYNADGSINKYWISYLAGFESIVNAQIRQEEADKAAKEAAEAAMAESDAQWAKINALTAEDWETLARQYSMPQMQRIGVEEQTGQVYFENLKDEGKTTYTFGARKIETHYAGLAGAMAEQLGITDTSSDQFRAILEQANSIGAYYEYANDIEMQNAQTAEMLDQINIVLGLSDSDWASAMATIGGGARQTYEAYTGQISEGYITDYEAFKGKKTYEFDDGTSASTEHAPLIEQVAADYEITDKKSAAFKALVLQGNMLAAEGKFDDPSAKTAEQIAAEQVDAVIALTEGDMAVAAAEVLEHGIYDDTSTESTRTPATASEAASTTTPTTETNTNQTGATSTQQASTYTPTEDDLGGLLDELLGEDGLNYSDLLKTKTYEFKDGTTITLL